MFNDHRENINETMNVNNGIQYKYNISKTFSRIKEYFLKIFTNILA